MLKGHEGAASAAAFSPDGRRIVTASQDGTARVWSADGGGEPLVLKGRAGRVSSAEFSLDGRRVVTASEIGPVRVWRIDWTDILDHLDRRTTACLSAARRVQYLGETAEEAKSRFNACERRFQRAPLRPVGQSPTADRCCSCELYRNSLPRGGKFPDTSRGTRVWRVLIESAQSLAILFQLNARSFH